MRSIRKLQHLLTSTHSIISFKLPCHRETIQVKRKTTPREYYTLSVSEELDASYIYLECDTSQYCTVTSTISHSQQRIGDRLMV